MLEEKGLLQNTLIILSGDNGPVLNNGYYDNAVEMLNGHDPSGGLRGNKYSLYEAGNKVPFIVYWKEAIKPAVSDALVCQIDFYKSMAAMLGVDAKTEDSENLSPVFLGGQKQAEKTWCGKALATGAAARRICIHSAYKGQAIIRTVNVETGMAPQPQLYDLKKDPAQRNNLAAQMPEKVAQMQKRLEQLSGRKFTL